MQKTFMLENDIGIKIKYTLLGISSNNNEKYVVYTDFFPSDNELGVRLLAGLLVDEEKFEIKKIRKSEEKKIIEDFKMDMFQSGKKIKRTLNKE